MPGSAPRSSPTPAGSVPGLTAEECRRRLSEARVARLATAGPGGRPHLVPICFALDRSATELCSAVDAKPKSGRPLRRLVNLAANPRASVLVDHYEEDWAGLWWVRVDGPAVVVDPAGDPDRHRVATGLLRARYAQYADHALTGPLLVLSVERLTGWTAGPAGEGMPAAP
ncbi:MAG: TIGR03668 family PPOX class F420-dependent oxidoreductase [Acidimicrobiales bacterium]